MKPIQQSILTLLAERPYTSRELHRHFNDGDDGITTRGFKNKQDYTKLHSWLNRHVRPLVRAGKVKQIRDQYHFISNDEGNTN